MRSSSSRRLFWSDSFFDWSWWSVVLYFSIFDFKSILYFSRFAFFASYFLAFLLSNSLILFFSRSSRCCLWCSLFSSYDTFVISRYSPFMYTKRPSSSSKFQYLCWLLLTYFFLFDAANILSRASSSSSKVQVILSTAPCYVVRWKLSLAYNYTSILCTTAAGI